MNPLPPITYVSNIYPAPLDPARGTFVENSLLGLRSEGREVGIITLDRSLHPLRAYLRFYWEVVRRLRREEGIAYVHYVSHSALPVVLAKLWNRRLRVALHFHGSDAFPESFENRARRFVKHLVCRLAIASADDVLAPSGPFADRLRAKFRIPDGDVSVNASAGVDRSTFQPHRRPERDTKHVVFAGRMIEGKGAAAAARALRRAFDQDGDDLRATFIGDGPEREEAEATLRAETGAGAVGFVPPVDQPRLAEYYQDADILLFPSTREGESLGLVMIEAIFCGAVPVAFDNPTARSILGGVDSPRLLADDEDDLARILSELRALPSSQLRAINDRLLADTAHFDSDVVSRELSRILR
ncbi:MAG: glycosyltransferase family 4 protein [Acidimicrobiales bacterium]|nr:glycosyltransferase family 4 protein [Acidimicrobiales bacterium]